MFSRFIVVVVVWFRVLVFLVRFNLCYYCLMVGLISCSTAGLGFVLPNFGSGRKQNIHNREDDLDRTNKHLATYCIQQVAQQRQSQLDHVSNESKNASQTRRVNAGMDGGYCYRQIRLPPLYNSVDVVREYYSSVYRLPVSLQRTLKTKTT